MNNYLLNEMLEYARKTSDKALGQKAYRIYCKCLLNKKTSLQFKIYEKYGSIFPKHSDAAIAFGYALLSQEKFNK